MLKKTDKRIFVLLLVLLFTILCACSPKAELMNFDFNDEVFLGIKLGMKEYDFSKKIDSEKKNFDTYDITQTYGIVPESGRDIHTTKICLRDDDNFLHMLTYIFYDNELIYINETITYNKLEGEFSEVDINKNFNTDRDFYIKNIDETFPELEKTDNIVVNETDRIITWQSDDESQLISTTAFVDIKSNFGKIVTTYACTDKLADIKE